MDSAGPSGAQATIPLNDPRLARCGFAKLQGDGIEFFMRKYEVVMGRTSKNSTLDLILGDNSTLSRQHASIRYNFENKSFELIVLGKNGVSVESSGVAHVYTPDSPPYQLRSRDLLIMGEKRLYFLLPRNMNAAPRKRRRLEPSPAPGADAQLAGAVPQLGAPPGPSSSPHRQPVPEPHAQSLPTAPAPHQQPQIHHHAPPAQASSAVPMAAAPGMPLSGAAPASLHPHDPHLQAHQAQHQEVQLEQGPAGVAYHQHHQEDGPGGGGGGSGATVGGAAGGSSAGLHMQQYESLADEDDALISGGGLPYDNGTAYGYDTGNNGFPGEF